MEQPAVLLVAGELADSRLLQSDLFCNHPFGGCAPSASAGLSWRAEQA